MNLKLNKNVAGHVYEGRYGQYEIKIEKGVSNKQTNWYPYIKVGGYWKLVSYYPTFKQAKAVLKQRIDNI
jgi:hypothetical protein